MSFTEGGGGAIRGDTRIPSFTTEKRREGLLPDEGERKGIISAVFTNQPRGEEEKTTAFSARERRERIGGGRRRRHPPQSSLRREKEEERGDLIKERKGRGDTLTTTC